ncbi:MAG TPA: alpha/beta hydrolase, partial [Beijerinckiaceae bacterium]|nr:alpha/beta hydrolase [Beijerinckiaceae bacterium]
MVAWHDFFTTSQDGLRLYARRLGPAEGRLTPVICLPGLARTTLDFEEVAQHLAASGDRTVWAFDYRGRGRSDRDPDWTHYDLRVELGDVGDQLTALGIPPAVFLGTSRGGMLTTLMAIARPAALRGAILNDIGPVIEGKGLARIKSYVGKLPRPETLEQGSEILKRISSSQFTAADPATWLKMAGRTWLETPDGLVPRYDVALMKTLEQLDLDAPLPDLWPQFGALSHVPLMVIRGSNSDLLSAETTAEMARRHPDCRVLEVPGEGHAPLLADAP